MEGVDPLIVAGIVDALLIFGRTEPQVESPDLDLIFAVEKDGGKRAPTAKIEHTHAGTQVQRRRQPFGHEQRVGCARDPSQDPFRVVLRRARKTVEFHSHYP
jgi:hypothetical protein